MNWVGGSFLAKRRRRRKQSKGYSCLPWTLLFLVILGLPVFLVRSCTIPFFSVREIPEVLLWDSTNEKTLTLSLEAYVQGVVAAEMPASFELEALKAQAVAARTYAYRRIVQDQRSEEQPGAHLSSDYQSGQAWISQEDFLERSGSALGRSLQRKIQKAVQQTSGLIAVYEDEPILAVYHSSSGGRTENSEHYWTEKLPYLRSVEDPYSTKAPSYYSTSSFTLAKVKEVLGVDTVHNFKVIERYPSGRVQTVEVDKTWFSGREIRQRLNLRSTWFTAEIIQNEIVFSVWGYGHGVGMSQYGAQEQALAGYDYEQILQYYYQGIQLRQVY